MLKNNTSPTVWTDANIFMLMHTYSWITPLCKEAQTQGRFGWKANPLTRADFDSNFVNIMRLLEIFTLRWLLSFIRMS